MNEHAPQHQNPDRPVGPGRSGADPILIDTRSVMRDQIAARCAAHPGCATRRKTGAAGRIGASRRTPSPGKPLPANLPDPTVSPTRHDRCRRRHRNNTVLPYGGPVGAEGRRPPGALSVSRPRGTRPRPGCPGSVARPPRLQLGLAADAGRTSNA